MCLSLMQPSGAGAVEPPAPRANFAVQKTPENSVCGGIYKLSLPLLLLPKAELVLHLGIPPWAQPCSGHREIRQPGVERSLQPAN